MCGITGFISNHRGLKTFQPKEIIYRMTEQLRHRGPDDSGSWSDSDTGIYLGHRRLSILDLSPRGRQPMVSESGRYVLVFNGEIYNYRLLRSELEGTHGGRKYNYRGESDTEVMLAAFESWGVKESVKKFNGMFAFGVWDRQERILQLGRDRVGQKPLYYCWAGKSFIFGSELKALRKHPDFIGQVDKRVLTMFMKYTCIPAPYSIYKKVYKLPPGCILSLSGCAREEPPGFSPAPRSKACDSSASPVEYWSANEVASRGVANPLNGSDEARDEDLRRLLMDSVKMRMVADVPLGVMLSGGIDSSTIAALMQAQSNRPIKTFSIGFQEESFNEARFASRVAKHLKTDHTELYVSPREAMDVIPKLPEIYDEPFADSSQIPTYIVSELARRYVTVALSGDGGDELFGGYNRYFVAPAAWKKVGWLPFAIRKSLAKLLLLPNQEVWEKAQPLFGFLVEGYGMQGTFGDKIQKIASVLKMHNADVLYRRLCSVWDNPEQAQVDGDLLIKESMERPLQTNISDQVLRMMLFDLLTYLPDDIMTKVDRASMAVSLETRSPFLDHRVIEFAWSLPLGAKVNQYEGKLPLRRILYKYVPKELIERPKAGFAVPIAAWLRGPLRDWAESVLSLSSLRKTGYFEPEVIRKLWTQHLSGRWDRHEQLWSVLMFQEWITKANSES